MTFARESPMVAVVVAVRSLTFPPGDHHEKRRLSI